MALVPVTSDAPPWTAARRRFHVRDYPPETLAAADLGATYRWLQSRR
jgi:hypothetical protein